MRQRIRNHLICVTALSLLTLSACSEAPNDGQSANVAADMADDGASSAMSEASGDGVSRMATAPESRRSGELADLPDIAVSMPKLAYTYDFAFRMPGEDIGKLQRHHADLCEQQGPMNCRILGMTKTGEDADSVTGELQLAVASNQARAFGALLEKEAESAGADEVSNEISTDELSKAIVDTEAQLRAREELRDRLMEVLRTRKGSVKDLVAAERSVADVNQKIDQARSWLKEMQGRVAYSRVNVSYRSGTAVTNDFIAPIRSAMNSLGGILGFVIAALIVLAAALGPIAGLVWLGRRVSRRIAPAQGA